MVERVKNPQVESEPNEEGVDGLIYTVFTSINTFDGV